MRQRLRGEDRSLLKYGAIAAALVAFTGLLVTSSSAGPAGIGPVFPAIQPASNLALVGLLDCRNFAGQTQASFYRHGPYIYWHRGFWYARPWWVGKGIGAEIDTGYDAYGGCFNDYDLAEGDYAEISSDEHIRWCAQHHRSYDPKTDSFLATDGYRHQCSSPFD